MKNTSICIDQDITWFDNSFCETPPDMISGLDVLLARLSAKWGDYSGTVLLERDVLASLGIPEELPKQAQRADHPALAPARSVGWKVSGLSTWMTFHRVTFPQKAVHVCVLPWLDSLCAKGEPDRSPCPIWSRDRLEMTSRMAFIRDIIGVNFHTSQGVTGLDALKRGHKGKIPYWRPQWSPNCKPATEEWDMRHMWSSELITRKSFIHGYDIRKQYLAAMNVTMFGVNQLTHTGAQEFNGASGWWKIKTPPWVHSQCPAPWGNDPSGTVIWCTEPTMQLMTDLAAQGAMVEPMPLDSWTSLDEKRTPIARRLMRPWAEKITRGLVLADALPDVADARAIGATMKGLYTHAWGMLMRESSHIHRPDWHHAISAMARCNLFRKIWAAGNPDGKMDGRWPVRIEHDTVYYASDVENGEEDAPTTFELENKIGKFKYEIPEDVTA